MGIEVSWFNEEKTAVLWVFIDTWQIADYHAAIKATAKMTYKMGEDYRFFYGQRFASKPSFPC